MPSENIIKINDNGNNISIIILNPSFYLFMTAIFEIEFPPSLWNAETK